MFRYYCIAVGVIIVDHVVKWLVSMYMTIGQQITVIPGVFGLASIRNKGAAFSILEGQLGFFIAVTSLVIIGIMIYLHRVYRENQFLSYGLALVLGGALGNYIDRVFKGEVVDMLQVHFFNFPIFNVADSLLCIGVAMIAIDSLRASRKDRTGIVSPES
ncbi:signal peptidase II [Paenibacillus sepulcri]|uniref:signal peptidase II n=1 Tax=Paenibacillus sepulcri TaxID=359917 RepID=UPI0035ECE301